MGSVRILCWNVNGIRAASRKGFLDWLREESPDILCVQETKAHPDQLDPELLQPQGYHVSWNHPETRGYSGVATFSKAQPLKVGCGFGVEMLDAEGRVVVTEYPDFDLFNVYFPNGKKNEERLR